MNGLTRYLPVDIPQTNIYSTYNVGRYRTVHFPHVPPYGTDILGITSHYYGLYKLYQSRGKMIRTYPRGTKKRITTYPLIGFHCNHTQLFCIPESSANTGTPSTRAPIKHLNFHVSNFHGYKPLFYCALIDDQD